MKKVKIGIPRALLYHKYYVFWKRFFEALGAEVVLSPDTNRAILSRGVNLAVDESCLSVKIFLGHVDYLKDKVDYVFVPHIVSLCPGEKVCVKLTALYDIVNNTFQNINLIDCTIDIDKLENEFFAFFKLGWTIRKNPIAIVNSYLTAKKSQRKEHKNLLSVQLEKIKNKTNTQPTILVVSHPYTTYDALLGKPILKFLETSGADVVYSDIIDYSTARELSKNISTDLYWTFNKELLGAIEFYKKHIDGIIFLMTFPCGPDSLAINLCQNKLKIPTALIVLDELQGEAGLKTRLESFVDILKLKTKHARATA